MIKFAKQAKYSTSIHFNIFSYSDRDNNDHNSNSITKVYMVVKSSIHCLWKSSYSVRHMNLNLSISFKHTFENIILSKNLVIWSLSRRKCVLVSTISYLFSQEEKKYPFQSFFKKLNITSFLVVKFQFSYFFPPMSKCICIICPTCLSV